MVLFAKDIVEKDFISLGKTTTVFEAARMMKAQRRGFVIVLSDEGRPRGIVTEWDILSKIVAEKKDPESVTVGDLMSAPLVSVSHNAGIEAVASLMTEKGVRRVMVLQGDRLLGVITGKTVLANMKNYIDRITSTISRLELTSF